MKPFLPHKRVQLFIYSVAFSDFLTMSFAQHRNKILSRPEKKTLKNNIREKSHGRLQTQSPWENIRGLSLTILFSYTENERA